MARNLILGVLVAAATIGCASTTSTQKSPAESRETTKNSLSSSANQVDLHCARDTGSRIERPVDKPCGAQPGRTYTQQELEQTGRLDVGEALKYLDPRLY